MRKLATLIALLAIISLALPSTAAAGRRWQEGGEVGLYNQGSCSTDVWEYAGHTNTSGSASRSGLKATIDLGGAFSLCTGNSSKGNIAAWIGVNNNPLVAGQAIKFGIVECRDAQVGEGEWDIFGSICKGENNPVFFYGYGGCQNGYWPYDAVAIADADYSPHTFAIYYDYDGKWHFNLDGNEVHSQWGTNPKLLCMNPLNDNLGVVYGYRTRNTGDSIANSSAPSYFFDARYGRYGLGWFNPLWTSGAGCQYSDGGHTCQFISQDDFKAYTVN